HAARAPAGRCTVRDLAEIGDTPAHRFVQDPRRAQRHARAAARAPRRGRVYRERGEHGAGTRLGGPRARRIAPDHAPRTKLEAIERLGATVRLVPFADWWRAILVHEVPGERGTFIHP